MILHNPTHIARRPALGAYDAPDSDILAQLAQAFGSGYDGEIVHQNSGLPILLFLGVLYLATK